MIWDWFTVPDRIKARPPVRDEGDRVVALAGALPRPSPPSYFRDVASANLFAVV